MLNKKKNRSRIMYINKSKTGTFGVAIGNETVSTRRIALDFH